MARQWRIEYPSALYHVMSRGNDRQPIFLDSDDKQAFLQIIAELTDRFSIEAYAFILMDNHYHLLLKTLEPNLSKAMQWLGTTYIRRFNSAHGKSGHLFQGRFKSLIIENDAYLLQLSCYIHCNPLRAGMVKCVADYNWSSYSYYGYKRKAPTWLTTKPILDQFKVKDPKAAYRRKVQQYAKEKSSVWEDVKHGLIYGSQDFVKQIRDSYLSDEKSIELPQQNKMRKDFDPAAFLQQAADILDCDLGYLKNARRVTAAELEKRDMMIYCLHKTGALTNEKIGKLFGLSYSSVSRRTSYFGKQLEKDNTPKMNYKKLKSQIKV